MHQLDPLTALQITAGTTIDRPVAVVRELIDNAIDAGAQHITIDVQDGVIEVCDDGCGMDGSDIAQAFLRHTTSKLRHYDDIHTITTLGFRGEALASIAAIARVTCISRPAHATHAYELRIAAGEMHDLRICAGAVGTRVRVERLYYTAPHRRAFWRQPPQELQLMADTVARYAVLFPHIAFRARLGDTLRCDTRGSGSVHSAVHEVWHAPIDDEIHATLPGSNVSVSGVIMSARAAAPQRRRQVIAINQRPLAPRGMLAHLLDELIPPHRNHYPAVVLTISLPRDMVDINIKASKEEVGVRAPSIVARALYYAMQPRQLTLPATDLPIQPFPSYTALGYHHEYVVAHSPDNLAIFNPATIMQVCGITQLARGAVLVPPYPLSTRQWQIMAPHQHAFAQLGLSITAATGDTGVITHLPSCAHQRPLSPAIDVLTTCLHHGGTPTMAVAALIDAQTLITWLSQHPNPWHSNALYAIHHAKIAAALRPRTTATPDGWPPPQTPPPPQ